MQLNASPCVCRTLRNLNFQLEDKDENSMKSMQTIVLENLIQSKLPIHFMFHALHKINRLWENGYIRLRSCIWSPQFGPTLSIFVGSTFSNVQWWGPILGLDVLQRTCSEKINMSLIDGKDVHYPTNEPNPIYVKNTSQEKLVPISSNRLKLWCQNCAT